MSVIRTLAQGGGTKKDAERGKLEEAYKETDDSLEKQVETNYDELSKTIKTFGSISSEITVGRTKVREIREKLNTCKQQLHCRQDELRKLWDEGLEQDKILSIIKEISSAKNAPHEISQFVKSKHYLHASRLLVDTINATKKFENVDALQELNTDLNAILSDLSDKLVDELTKHIYVRSADSIKKNNHAVESKSFDAGIGTDIADVEKVVEEDKKVEYDENGCAIEDKNDKFPEKSKNRFTATLVQSCVELDGCLIEIVESIKERMDREISNVISRATLIISDKAYFQRNGNQTSNLVDLLELLFNNFKSIAAAHKFLIKCLKKQAKILRNEGCDESEIGQIYTMDDVWSKITANLESLLRRYLEDTSQTSSENFSLGAAAANPASIDFWKSGEIDGGITATKKLFKFDASMHAKSMNEYWMVFKKKPQNDLKLPFRLKKMDFQPTDAI